MKKSFRDTYERELDMLYEHSAEFARDYPGLADKLGGLLRDNIDPAVAGLLEGTAFMAARVQQKLDEEFRSFTTELLEQIFPDALAPVPSCMLVEASAAGRDPARHLPRGTPMDAPFREAGQRVQCRYRLTAPLTLAPWRIGGITWLDRTALIGALGRDPDPQTRAGLLIELAPIGEGGGDTLTFHITSPMAQAIALYEHIHCDALRVSLRWLDRNGDPVFVTLRPDQIAQIGFDDDETLFDRDTRIFSGFATLRDFFVFPRKFLGFALTGIGDQLRNGRDMQLLFEFGQPDADLARQTGNTDLRLNCAAAINLFDEVSNNVRLDDRRYEYVVTPDASPMTHYEVHRIQKVTAIYGSVHDKADVFPLYAVPQGDAPREALYYTARRKPRRLTTAERRAGFRADYRGTETFIWMYEPPGGRRATRLQIQTLCSNRHLPAALPLTDEDAFQLPDDTDITLRCVAGPTPPREAMTETERAGPHRTGQGDVYWRLISYLALNHFGLDDRYGRDGAASLRELLTLFADMSDSVTEAQIAGLTSLAVRPVTRSLRRPEGYFPARGLEISVTFDETAFEGSGIILMAAVLDRFLAEYASINSFTQMVVVSRQRGEVKRWPPRAGSGPLL
ncbi:MAG: type VI secretion system baseplate subunit TssF [Paracoccus sp. (in: a-proteobacteria)]|nr:type VI secretion system baseplate subunit TssF [Paracoccus sp. (in: a-proteobacteria)]